MSFPIRTSLIVLLLASARVLADESSASYISQKLEELVVSGTLTELAQMDSPVRVEVISSAEIEQLHALQLDEAVKQLPGVSLRPVRGKEGQEAWMQGISANRVLVLVDGEEVSASTGSAVDLTQIATTSVARIEVVKGATSVLYGSDAMGGVINVIPAVPDPGFSARLSADAGSWGEQNENPNQPLARRRAQANMSLNSEHWLFDSDLNARFSDGWAVDPAAWNQQGADGHKINFRLGGRYKIDSRNFVQLRHEIYDQKQHTRLTEYKANNAFEHDKHDDATREHTSLRINLQTSAQQLSLVGFHEDYENISAPNNIIERKAYMDSDKLSLKWHYFDFYAHSLTVGLDYFGESLQQTKQEQAKSVEHELQGDSKQYRDAIDAFIQDEFDVGGWALVPGLRTQYDSDFGQHTVAKINFRKDLLETNSLRFFTRGGVGSGYRVPNLKERYYIFDHSALGYMVLGNSELEPESSLSYQLGFVLTDSRLFQFDVNFYLNQLDGLIDTQFKHQEGFVDIYGYTNVSEAETSGVELNLSWSPLNSLQFQGGWVYLQAVDKKTNQRLVDRPRNQIKFNANYLSPWGTQLSLLGQWQDEEYDAVRDLESPSWASFDAKLNHAFNSMFSLYGGVDNITATQRDFYAGYDQRPQEGRMIYLGFKLQTP
ncbi:TonB-dependent receptor plug domain-containing protein [Agaribacterium haliotis]|uniref:TonB-dependent receptor plug domain-containing protein n=1 Tax=Agaribacterium haliotis TaxID=2013869 RepID=UPI000BB5890E|nr:TonB-dependent receptor [Agaribacterium haliotis]